MSATRWCTKAVVSTEKALRPANSGSLSVALARRKGSSCSSMQHETGPQPRRASRAGMAASTAGSRKWRATTSTVVPPGERHQPCRSSSSGARSPRASHAYSSCGAVKPMTRAQPSDAASAASTPRASGAGTASMKCALAGASRWRSWPGKFARKSATCDRDSTVT